MSKGTPLCVSWKTNTWGIKMFCGLPRGHWSDQHLYSLTADEWTEKSLDIIIDQNSQLFRPGPKGRKGSR